MRAGKGNSPERQVISDCSGHRRQQEPAVFPRECGGGLLSGPAWKSRFSPVESVKFRASVS